MRGTLIVAGIWMLFVVFRVFVVSGPFAGAALNGGLIFSLAHILLSIPFLFLTAYMRDRQEN